MEARQSMVEFSATNASYRHMWSRTAYNSFPLLKMLLELTKISLRDYIQEPKSLKVNEATLSAAIEEAKDGKLEDLWQTATVTCTI